MNKIDILVLEGSRPAVLGVTLDVIDTINRLAGEEWRNESGLRIVRRSIA